jgi:AsmA protein
MQRMHVLAGAGLAALVLLLAGWMIFAPGWVTARLQEAIRAQLGRDLKVTGGAHLNFSPLSVQLDGLRLEDPAAPDDALATAKSARIPISFMGLVGRNIDLTRATLVDPEFAFLVNEKGDANWALPAPKTPEAIRLDLENASIRFFDARIGQSFTTSGGTLAADITADGGLAVSGTTVVKDRLVKTEATLKSLARVHEDGSPFQLNFDAPDLGVTFEGRLATAKTLSLVGTVSLSGTSLHQALDWMGIDTGRDGEPGFTVSGALETAGRAFAVKSAELSLGNMRMSGDMSIDVRSERPRFDGLLSAADFDLAPFVPATGSSADDWGRNPLGLGALRELDATIAIKADSLRYAELTAGPSQINMTLAEGQLDSQINMSGLAGGAATLQVTADATTSPPVLGLGFKAEAVDFQSLLAPYGISWISGRGNLVALVSGQGATQQELIGALKGEAEASIADGALTGLDIASLFAAASQRIVEGWASQQGAATGFATLTARATIADGIATMSNLALSNPTLTLTGGGDVDLLRRSLDLSVDPRVLAADGTSSGLPVSLRVSGPWATPRIYPDIADILSKPEQAYERLRAMGLQQQQPQLPAPAMPN